VALKEVSRSELLVYQWEDSGTGGASAAYSPLESSHCIVKKYM